VTPLFPTSAIVRAPERLMLSGGRWTRLDIPIRYGLWLHERHGPVLIDTGYSQRVTSDAQRSIGLKLYNALLRPRLIEANAPSQQLRALGFGPADVTRIVVTHFHADHVAGLHAFPNARILASADAFSRLSRMSKRQQLHNAYYPELLPGDFASRLLPIEDCLPAELPHGLGRGSDLFGDRSLLAVPLPGHALGHFGLLWPEQSLLYAVDAQWLLKAIMERRLPRGPARLIYSDQAEVIASCEKVRGFAVTGGRVVLCHDPQPVDLAAPRQAGS
jgi:glyoxylase-like metal-dependent hydrolase (beta-lactamase superfamily II)